MKQYEVEVMGRYSHGCYGKEHYFGMVVSVESCKQAEMFADDLLYEMTYEEFFERCINHFKHPYAREQFMTEEKMIPLQTGGYKFQVIKHELSDRIGDAHKFTFKARVFRG